MFLALLELHAFYTKDDVVHIQPTNAGGVCGVQGVPHKCENSFFVEDV